MDRHVIANMGAELGATTTVFPSDEARASLCVSSGAKTVGAQWPQTQARTTTIPKVSEFTFESIDDGYAGRAAHNRDLGGDHAIVGGANYGQGSSCENAAIAPRCLGA